VRRGDADGGVAGGQARSTALCAMPAFFLADHRRAFPRSRHRGRAARGVALAALLLAASAPAPAGAAGTVFSDDFETGTLGKWTVMTAVDGSAGVRSNAARTAANGAQLSASATNAQAAARRALPRLGSVGARLDVRVDAEGAAGSNVPLVRLFGDDGRRILSLYRQNKDSNRVYIQHSGDFHATTGRVALGTWTGVDVRATSAGTKSRVEVLLDGVSVYRTDFADLGSAGIAAVQIGNDTRSQAFSTAVDNVVVTDTTPAPPPDAGAADGCDSTTPAPSNSDPGRTILADNFEHGLGKWSDVYTTGGGTAAAAAAAGRAGGCGLRWHVPEEPYESQAYLAKWLPSGVADVRTDGWFKFERLGSDPNWNAPTFRFFSAGKRILDVSRSNRDGKLFVRYPDGSGGWAIWSTDSYLPAGTWFRLRVHATARGASSLVEVWLDGSLIYRTTAATLGTSTIQRVMLGSEHNHQVADVVADDVIIKVP
jgi:hypothetical protein